MLFRKEFPDTEALTLKTQNDEYIHYNGTKDKNITASEMGAWIILVSDGVEWNVVIDKGDWLLD